MSDQTIGVVGLGYVGLPLAVAFAATRDVVGLDSRHERIRELQAGEDRSLEVGKDELAAATRLHLTSDPADLARCSVIIVAVPTPVDQARRPDLGILAAASETVGSVMRKGTVVVYESTVYPGCTRTFCAPILEKASGLRADEDFFLGYSPERSNPGDREHRLDTIVKVTSGSTPEVAERIDRLYGSIIAAGTHRAASIEVAEAAKVIENTQRDLNIALMNELAIIFDRMGLDTAEVLAAAGTKWNFLPFRPGLVGGHCIGVDPYYLTHRAQELGYHPEVILAGRRINDSMGPYVADRVLRLMARRRFPIVDGRVLVMGLTFKENCPDIRNSKVVDLIRSLEEYGAAVDVWDPWVDPAAAAEEYDLATMTEAPEQGVYDAIVVAVAHGQFRTLGAAAVRGFGREGAVLFDVKGIFDRNESDGRI